MKKKIFLLTTGRSDYGMLRKLALDIVKEKNFSLKIIVTGAHLSKEHGYTVKEIIKDNFKNIIKVNSNLKDSSKNHTTISISNSIKEFHKIFLKHSPNIAIVLGDRYETFAFSIAANTFGVPIAHLNGGEVTSGAQDDVFRHCITKMSDLHFVANKIYAKRVKQLGEDPSRIFNVGGLSIDKISTKNFYKKKDLEKKLKIKFLKKNLLITYHPETLNNKKNNKNLDILLKCLDKLNDTYLIFTIPNADYGNQKIIKKIKNFVSRKKNAKVFDSLGHITYYSVIRQVDAMVGNSSSGLSEAPFLKKATLNLGNRQEGRIQAKSVINCQFKISEINKGLKKLYSKKFIDLAKKARSPYGKNGVSKKIISILKMTNLKNIKYKKFYDLN